MHLTPFRIRTALVVCCWHFDFLIVPAGRPSKLTPELVTQTRELAAQGLPMGMICQQLGVNHATAWRWMKAADEDEDGESGLKAQFRNAINDSGVALAKTLIENLRYQAGNGDTKANIFLLTHHPATRDHFSEAAATRKVEKRVIADVVGAIARSELTSEAQTRLLLEIQALGHTLPPEGEQG